MLDPVSSDSAGCYTTIGCKAKYLIFYQLTDDSEPVERTLWCEVCGKPNDEVVMMVCECCNRALTATV